MRKRKRNKDNIKLIALIFFLSVIFLSLFITFKNDNLSKSESVIKDNVYRISNILSYPFIALKEKFTDKKNKDITNVEYLGLNEEILNENKELKKLLELNNSLSDREYINATIINRNVSIWLDEVTINKGINDGVDIGMAVISSSGLIGKVIKTSNYTSIVKLITSSNRENKISVKISTPSGYVYGLMGNYENGYFIVDGISNNDEITSESTVTTSGLTDLFPSGIYIGKVNKIDRDNFDLVRVLQIESDVNFNDLYYVTVLKRKVDDNND